MRIISGKYKGRIISPPKGLPARPTTDLSKESLFNILNNQLDLEDLEVLDLFAGTGNISLEFLSRGAANVTCVESHAKSCAFIQSQTKEWGYSEIATIIKSDVFSYLKKNEIGFDLIFADPPYDLKNLNLLPDLIMNSNTFKENTLLIIEHVNKISFKQNEYLVDSRIYGQSMFSFFSK